MKKRPTRKIGKEPEKATHNEKIFISRKQKILSLCSDQRKEKLKHKNVNVIVCQQADAPGVTKQIPERAGATVIW